jgi:hypothetical protein
LSNKSIWVVTSVASDDVSKSVLPSLGKATAIKSIEIANDVLANNLTDFFDGFGAVLVQLPVEKGGFSLDEIEVSLTIDATGAVKLIGEVGLGFSTGLKFTLKRHASHNE